MDSWQPWLGYPGQGDSNKYPQICFLKYDKKAFFYLSYYSILGFFIVTRARGYKTFFMLNSAENEICFAYKKLNTINLNIFPALQNWAWNFSRL